MKLRMRIQGLADGGVGRKGPQVDLPAVFTGRARTNKVDRQRLFFFSFAPPLT